MADEGVIVPDFEGDVIQRPPGFMETGGLKVGVDCVVNDYVAAIYGYGSTSHPTRSSPRAVLYAKTEDDIMKAITYAHENKIALSCRSGGHQYGMFSSTTGDNITVDVSSFNNSKYDRDAELLTVEVGCKLEDVIAALAKEGQMVSHGECTWVRVGGHAQTGGYSPFFCRSFGFFCDNIVEFTIICPPNETHDKPYKMVVPKPDKRIAGDPLNDIWWAIFGGSPGNFGMLTQVKVKGIKDSDHADAHCMSVACYYDANKDGQAKFQEFLQILAEYADDDDLPADYIFNVIFLKGEYCCESATTDMHVLLSSSSIFPPTHHVPRHGF
jgi:FAD/FMN-containing dehydrogenase